jgi:subtilisin family serine protease
MVCSSPVLPPERQGVLPARILPLSGCLVPGIGFLRTGILAGLLLAIGSTSVQAQKVPEWLDKVCQKLTQATAPGDDDDDDDNQPLSSYSNSLVRVNDAGFVHVYLCTNVPITDALRQQFINNYGFQEETVNTDLQILQGWLPFNQVANVAARADIRSVQPPDYVQCFRGSVTTQGDALHRANRVRSEIGITGRGVKIGVISDGMDNRAAAVATGDLPAGIPYANHPVTGLPMQGGGDEGTAMLEIIYDLAPGASLVFAGLQPGVATTLDMINAIIALTNAGCQIIVDDLGFFQSPYFEDGPVAQAAQAAVNAGIFYCSAANNHADKHYQGGFRGGGDPGITGNPLTNVHLFAGASVAEGDFRCAVTLPGLTPAVIVLQWSDRFGASANDYDLYLFDGDTLLASSINVQDGDDDPIEIIQFIPPDTVNADIVIDRKGGVSNRILEFFLVSPNDARLEEFRVPGDSIFGHQAATGVFAVGAVIPDNPNRVEDFSGRGPSSIRWPAWTQRNKPQACAINGVDVTGAGGFQTPFWGTSAAAPHVAAIAALILDIRPGLTPAQVTTVLQSNAVDLYPFGLPGFDFISGAGRVDAYDSVKCLRPSVDSLRLSRRKIESTSAGTRYPVGGQVRLDYRPLFDPVTVTLTTSNRSVASLSTFTLTFNPGESTQTFQVQATALGPPAEAEIAATANDGSTKSALLKVIPTEASSSSGGACFIARLRKPTQRPDSDPI